MHDGMGRPLRIAYSGALYHITSRGNERRSVFLDDEDRLRFLATLKDYHDRYGTILHAYVLMDNHYHLVMETPGGNLVKVMHGINGGYTGYFNRKYGRAGHLFQGRYKAILVDKESYLVELSRYVHLNPVRARVVKRPEEYRWSSYPGFINKSKARDWIEYGWVLGRFGEDTTIARKRYRVYVHGEVTESPLKKVYGQVILGGDSFLAQARRIIKGDLSTEIIGRKRIQAEVNPESIIQAVAGAFAVEEDSVTEKGKSTLPRNAAMYLMKRYSGLGNREIGELFGGLHYSGVSKICTRFEERLKKDKHLAGMINRLLSRFKT
jgi:putative transposase